MLDGLFALLKDSRVEPNRCMPPIDKSVLAITNELSWVVPDLDMTNRIILAHALADPDSVFLVTKDHMIVNNPAIKKYEENARAVGRRNIELKIFNPTETYHAP